MKRKCLKELAATIAAAVLVSACLTACGGQPQTDGTEATTQSVVAAETEAAEADGSVKVNIDAFPSGVWIGTSENCGRRYFSFYSAPKGGNVLSQDSGTGLGFDYEITDGDQALFHMGAVDDETPAEILSVSDEKIELMWNIENAKFAETLEFYSPDVESFDFTADDELMEMAQNYYELQNGKRPQKAESTPAENGMMLVHVYDEDGANEAFYTISPIDLKGTDADGSETDFTNVPMG